MTALTATHPTLLDIAKSKDPTGKTAAVVEILNLTNGVLEDMSFITGNLDTGHESTIRAGLPDATWTKLYQGVPNSKSTRVTVVDNCGTLETESLVDDRALEMAEDKAGYLLSESKAFLEAMAQEVATTLFTGNESVNPEQFTGLAPRYNSLSAENACNIISAASTDTTANASIWLIGWSPETITGIVPKGSMAGLQVKDMGSTRVLDSNDNAYYASVTRFSWKVGLAVRDWRYAVRIANIDRSALRGDFASGPNLPDLLDQAIELIPNTDSVKLGFYMDRDLLSMLRRQSKKATANTYTIETLANGKRIATYGGIALKRTDALHVDETLVS